jgi:hypothetical protein
VDAIIITRPIVFTSGRANAKDAVNSDIQPINVGIRGRSVEGMKRVKERIRGTRR